MSDRDDAPPAEAVEAMRWAIVSRMQSNGTTRARGGLRALRTLPDAARWRLAAWIVAGLEPTREMVEAIAPWTWAPDDTATEDYHREMAADVVKGMLAAAREAGDGQ